MPEIVAISETKKDLINRNIELESYSFLYSESKKCAGEVGLYINDMIEFSINLCSKFDLPDAEHLRVDIQSKRGPI